MPSQPETVNDTVLYQLRNFYGDQNITVRMLDGSILDIWGPVFVNGNALTLIGALPIATNAEALAGTDNTKVMTPLRVREAGDARYLKLTGGIISGPLDVTGLVYFPSDLTLGGGLFQNAGQYAQLGNLDVMGNLTIVDEAYGVSWNGSNRVPTKNAIYDKIESIPIGITQTAADTRYVNATGDTITGNLTVNPQIVIGDNTGSSTLALRSFNAPNYMSFIRNNVTSWYFYDANSIYLYFRDMVNARMALTLVPGTASTMRLDVGGRVRYASDIPDDPYSATWNGSFDLPTKNEVYDKIETIVAGGGITQAAADLRYLQLTGGALTGGVTSNSTLIVNPGAIVGRIVSSLNGGAGAAPSITMRFGYAGLEQYMQAILTTHDAGTAGNNSFVFRTWQPGDPHQTPSNTVLTLNGAAIIAAKPVAVPDEAYGASWNGSVNVPTKNAVYDKIETLGGGASISDTVYGVGWDGDTTNGASKNAIYDKIEALDALIVHKAGTETITGAKNFNSSITVGGLTTLGTVLADAAAVTGEVTVGEVAYSSAWDGSNRVPTRNAVYDEMETKVASTTVNIMWTGNQAAYDAIGTKDPATMYVVI